MEVQITPVILSGGSGTRLWPLSLPAHPKQLQALIGSETMIQATVRRLSGLEGVTAPIVVCNEIQAETAGVVEKVLVNNGEPVEFGQKLLLIRPK